MSLTIRAAPRPVYKSLHVWVSDTSSVSWRVKLVISEVLSLRSDDLNQNHESSDVALSLFGSIPYLGELSILNKILRSFTKCY